MSSRPALVCARCGYEEPEGSRFCGNCGTPFEPVVAEETASSAPALTCANCGYEEPEGSPFCGNCGASFEPAEQPHADTEASLPLADQPSRDESRPAPASTGRRRRRWIAAGAVAAVLLAAGSTAAVLTGGDTPRSAPTEEETLPSTSSETQALETSPTLADSITPSLEDVSAAQTTVNARVRALGPSAGSFAALRQAGDSLARSVTRAQGFLDTLTPSGSTEANTLSLLSLALSNHRAYANTISTFPTGPPAFTKAQARLAIAQAEKVRRAYVDLVNADPTLPIVYISGSDHNSLLAAVPAPKPTPTVTQRVIELAPLLVGIGPDDPLGEGRCFGRYSSRATLRMSGVVHSRGFIQCGDDAAGDPSRASGIYRFSGRAFPSGSRLARITAQAAIDESSSSSQRGTRVVWNVFYSGAPLCSTTVVWSGSRPSPRELDCPVPASASSTGFDLQRLRIQQVAFPTSSGDLWAGLLNPRIVVVSR